MAVRPLSRELGYKDVYTKVYARGDQSIKRNK